MLLAFTFSLQATVYYIDTTCYRRIYKMDISRKLGILVFCGVPAIIGGGIVYAVFGSYVAVLVYEVILLLAAGAFASK